jgi:hypothetical protein
MDRGSLTSSLIRAEDRALLGSNPSAAPEAEVERRTNALQATSAFPASFHFGTRAKPKTQNA